MVAIRRNNVIIRAVVGLLLGSLVLMACGDGEDRLAPNTTPNVNSPYGGRSGERIVDILASRSIEVTFSWTGHPAGSGLAVLRQTSSNRRWDSEAGGVTTQGSFVVVEGDAQDSVRGCLWFSEVPPSGGADVSCSYGWAAGIESVADAILSAPLGRQLANRDVMGRPAICYESEVPSSSICVDSNSGVPVYMKSGEQELEALEIGLDPTSVSFPPGVSLDQPWYAEPAVLPIGDLGLPARFVDALG
jgi:hypothetical protein